MKRTLPIDRAIPSIVESIRETPRLVVRADPGAGKTTRIPSGLVDSGLIRADSSVLVLEPRRIAARMAATRVAMERDGEVGGEVGYQVRFDERISRQTRIRFVTEGLLLRRLQHDPQIEDVDAVVLDEFHERSIHADLALALLREIQESLRPDLRILVMSATLDPDPIRDYLGGCPVLNVPGREHPISIEYHPDPDPRAFSDGVLRAVSTILSDDPEGSILVFVPGAAEIRSCLEILSPLARSQEIDLLPLHGNLPLREQEKAIRNGPNPRVVIATNVAEASVTVEGIHAVIDTGRARVARYDQARGLDHLSTERICRSSAIQRAGRAGRLGPGRCIRLYGESDFARFREFDEPEIERVDPSEALLQLLAWGSRDVERFDWLTPPRPDSTRRALDLLEDLGAVQGRPGRITNLGRSILRYPVHPRHGRILEEAVRSGVGSTGALWVALLAERDILRSARSGFGGPPDGHHGIPAGRLTDDLPRTRSDLSIRSDRLLAARQSRFSSGRIDELGLDRGALRTADRMARRLERLCARDEEKTQEHLPAREEAVRRALLAGYPDRVVRMQSGGSKHGMMVGSIGVELDPASSVRDSELLLALELLAKRPSPGNSRGRFTIRSASAIEERWLHELFPEQMRTQDTASFDGTEERVVVRRVTLYRDLEIVSRMTGAIDPETAASLLADAATLNPSRAITRDRDLEALIQRLTALGKYRPELPLEEVESELLPTAIRTLCAGRRSFAELRKTPVAPVLLGLLDPTLRAALERFTPERLRLPSGRRARVDYGDAGGAPVLAARIQEFFGLETTPTVDGGRIPVLLHLLAPNHRPVQVTRDLPSFWRTIYPRIRTELSRRYPKHAWPTDPLRAPAESRPSRRPGPGKPG